MSMTHAKKHRRAPRRIGLLGGSFNPAHDGHVAISLFACARLGLDGVWWIVAPQNPMKKRDEMLPYAIRLMRARALCAHQRGIVVTDLERRFGTQYTVDTLRAIKKRYPEDRFVFLMGEDNFASLHLWKSWREIFLEVPIAVFSRSGYSSSHAVGDAQAIFAKAQLPLASVEDLAESNVPAWVMLDNALNPLSATQIRQRENLTSTFNPSHEGVRSMAVAKKKPAKKAVKKVAKKPAKKAVKKVAKKPAAKKKVAKKK